MFLRVHCEGEGRQRFIASCGLTLTCPIPCRSRMCSRTPGALAHHHPKTATDHTTSLSPPPSRYFLSTFSVLSQYFFSIFSVLPSYFLSTFSAASQRHQCCADSSLLMPMRQVWESGGNEVAVSVSSDRVCLVILKPVKQC